jgi:hypothetical protein
MKGSPTERKTSSSVAPPRRWPCRSNTPYSESFTPIFMARVRSAMLCDFDPVK